MDQKAQYVAFARAIIELNDKLLGLLEKNQIRESYPMPANQNEAKALLGSIADEVMLCGDIDAVVKKIMENKATALLLLNHWTECTDAYTARTLERAFRSRPIHSEILPGQAYATYLLQIVADWPPELSDDFLAWVSSL